MGDQAFRWDSFFKFPKESFELVTGGFEMYNRMMKSWMDYIEMSSSGETADMSKNWMENYRNLSADILSSYSKPFQTLGIKGMEGKNPWEDLIKAWRKSLEGSPAGLFPAESGMDELVRISKSWQENYTKVFNSWLTLFEKTADAYKSGKERGEDPEQVWKSCLKTSEDFLEAWTAFVAEQAKTFFQWQALSGEKGDTPAPKKESRKKEGKS
ncbi:MAG: hypothetical protein PHG91_06915 [Syntrophales bacterium]|nr:hypothetical protein [Syntrophales bacterium]MDD5532461.1 hypothetical protein [Syntrophales bacterium]HPL63987.1 hypothetical protein [Syntrophales bacterium]